MPVAVELENMAKAGVPITDTSVDEALRLHPVLRRHHISSAHLPNMLRKIVRTCFSSHRPGNRSMDPIGHILNKAWPMRCSVRNFSEIVSAYIIADCDIYKFMLMVLHACMAGAYTGTTVNTTITVKMLLYRHYVHEPISPEHLATWVQQNNHILLFVAIKEYIAYAVSTVPGLSSVLDHAYKWQSFVASVTHQADTIRTTLNQYSATPHTMFEKALAAVVPIRSYKCRTPLLDQGTICENLQTALRMAFHPTNNVYHRPMRMAIYLSIRGAVQAGVPPYDIAVAAGIPPDTATRMSRAGSPLAPPAAWRAVRATRCNTTDDALLLHEFVQAWTMCYRIVTYPLPQHIADEQAGNQIGGSRTIFACA